MPQPTLTAHSHAFPPRLTRAQCQELLIYLFASTLLLLLLMAAGVAYRYALPVAQHAYVGKITRFQVNQPVHVYADKANVWVVNTGQEILALHAIPNDQMKCLVRWEAERQRFADPCRGARYNLRGIFISGPAPIRSLDRYPVQLHANGDLSIELTKPILGQPWQYLEEACAIQLKRSEWNRPDYWMDYCNFDLIGLEVPEE